MQEKSLENVESCRSTINQVQESLSTLLLSKRTSNPRLFFLTDQQALKLYSSDFPLFLDSLLKVFPGVREFLGTTEGKITGFISNTHETVLFVQEIEATSKPESVGIVSLGIQNTIKQQIIKTFAQFQGVGIDFLVFWKAILQKSNVLQAICVVMDLLFWEEIRKSLLKGDCEMFFSEIKTKTSQFIKKAPKKANPSYFAFIMRILQYAETVKGLLFDSATVKGLNSFEYLAFPKLHLKNLDNNTNTIEISLISLNYSQDYGFEAVRLEDQWPTPQYTPRLQFNFLLALGLQKPIFLQDDTQSQGFEALTNYLARPYYNIICQKNAKNVFESLEICLIKAAEAGFWLTLTLKQGSIPKTLEVLERGGYFNLGVILDGVNIKEVPKSFREKLRHTSLVGVPKEPILEMAFFSICGDYDEARDFSQKMLVFSHCLLNSLYSSKDLALVKDLQVFLIGSPNAAWGLITQFYREMRNYCEQIHRDMNLLMVFEVSCQKVLEQSFGEGSSQAIGRLVDQIFQTKVHSICALKENDRQWQLEELVREILKKKNRSLEQESIEKVIQIIEALERKDGRVLQIVGRTSCGKTAALKLAAEVYSHWKRISHLK